LVAKLLRFLLNMKSKQEPFWRTKTLGEMTRDEWESLCDCCGMCCLEKLEDKAMRTIELTSVACTFMDITNCRCMIYENRAFIASDCIELTPDLLRLITWLPETCAYRCVDEGGSWNGGIRWYPVIRIQFTKQEYPCGIRRYRGGMFIPRIYLII